MNPRKYVVELIGTFFLMLTVGLCVIGSGLDPKSGIIPPLAIGSILMTMIYAGGHISGAHYNPAVTLGVFVRRRIGVPDLVAYWIAQIIGAALAALVVGYLRGYAKSPVDLTGPGAMPKAALAEFLFTFALAYVVLNVATSKDTAGNSNYGLAIGFTVLAGAFAVGGVSGGAFNPAVAIGGTILNLFSASYVWLHVVADLAGGALAGAVFLFLNPDDV